VNSRQTGQREQTHVGCEVSYPTFKLINKQKSPQLEQQSYIMRFARGCRLRQLQEMTRIVTANSEPFVLSHFEYDLHQKLIISRVVRKTCLLYFSQISMNWFFEIFCLRNWLHTDITEYIITRILSFDHYTCMS